MDGSNDTQNVDGRTARRQRNIDAALDAVMETLAEGARFPTMEQVSTRSGVSLRSLYRYFASPEELAEATLARTSARARVIAAIENVGEGPLEHRIVAFVAARLRLHEAAGAAQQGTLYNTFEREQARTLLNQSRALMRSQLELQFEPELSHLTDDERMRVVAAADLLTQLESLWYLRTHRELSLDQMEDVLVDGLRRLLR